MFAMLEPAGVETRQMRAGSRSRLKHGSVAAISAGGRRHFRLRNRLIEVPGSASRRVSAIRSSFGTGRGRGLVCGPARTSRWPRATEFLAVDSRRLWEAPIRGGLQADPWPSALRMDSRNLPTYRVHHSDPGVTRAGLLARWARERCGAGRWLGAYLDRVYRAEPAVLEIVGDDV